MIKANFKISKSNKNAENKTPDGQTENELRQQVTKEEFEDIIVKSGAAGSFMIFRSKKKDEEMGLEEL